jgi:hypothetical protein
MGITDLLIVHDVSFIPSNRPFASRHLGTGLPANRGTLTRHPRTEYELVGFQ